MERKIKTHLFTKMFRLESSKVTAVQGRIELKRGWLNKTLLIEPEGQRSRNGYEKKQDEAAVER